MFARTNNFEDNLKDYRLQKKYVNRMIYFRHFKFGS
jgi:hypothetical protein